MDKEKIINLLKEVKKEIAIFEKRYQGGGVFKKIKRFLRYREEYIKYILAKLGIYRHYRHLSYFGLLNSGWREIKSIEYFIKNIKKGDVFYDIGANEGLFSVILKEIFDDMIEIHCFEPIPRNFSILSKNLTKRKNVFLNNFALLDYIGKIDFNIPKKELLFASSTIIEEGAKKYLGEYKKITVNCSTLDEYVKTHNLPTFIKMDVEGSEYFVISGGMNLFKNHSPQIIMEIQTGEIGMRYSLLAAKTLIDLGYSIFKIEDETGELLKLSEVDLIKFIQESRLNEDNFLFRR